MRWKGYILDGVGSSPPTIQTAGRATTLPDSHLKFGLGLVRKHLAGAEVISGRLQICTRTHCSKHAMFMIHPTSMSGAEGASATRLQSALNAALADDQRTEDILRERTSIPDDLLRARRTTDVHIDAQKALQMGLVHGVREFTLPPGNQVIQI